MCDSGFTGNIIFSPVDFVTYINAVFHPKSPKIMQK